MNIPLLGYLLKVESQSWLRRAIWCMFFASYPAIIFTYSRGAWLGMGAVSVLMVLRNRNRVMLIMAALTIGVVLSPILVELAPRRLQNRYEALENYETESSAQMRFGSWAYCRRVGLANPLTGGGFDHYSVRSYREYAPEYQEKWQNQWLQSSCHSSWFLWQASHPGFLVWLGLFGSIAFEFDAPSGLSNNAELEWIFNLVGALQISLIGYAVVQNPYRCCVLRYALLFDRRIYHFEGPGTGD